MPQVPVAQLKDYIGKELGHSEWLTIDQQRVDRFADCTGDHQFIHVDPEKAAQTPFGGTIAHGFLSLSLLPMLSGDLLVVPEGTRMGVNYGLDSLRFIQPVRVGSRVRLGLTLIDAHEKNPRSVAAQSPRSDGDRRLGETGLHRRNAGPVHPLSSAPARMSQAVGFAAYCGPPA